MKAHDIFVMLSGRLWGLIYPRPAVTHSLGVRWLTSGNIK